MPLDKPQLFGQIGDHGFSGVVQDAL
jgi:hypothetical protein